MESGARRRRQPDRHRSIRGSSRLYAGTQLYAGIQKMKKVLFAGIFLAASVLMAQTDSASIRVYVTDSTEANISEASVILSNVATGVKSSSKTDSDGYATFSPISRGSYTVDVEKTGFQTVHVTDLSVDINETKLVRANLPVASVATALVVSESANVIQTEQGSLG